MRLLERELATLDEGDRPLSIAVIGPLPTERGTRQRLARQIRERLRAADTLCRLSDDELLVIARDTGERAAAALAEELERHLTNGGAPIRVRTRTALTTTTPAELVESARNSAPLLTAVRH